MVLKVYVPIEIHHIEVILHFINLIQLVPQFYDIVILKPPLLRAKIRNDAAEFVDFLVRI